MHKLFMSAPLGVLLLLLNLCSCQQAIVYSIPNSPNAPVNTASSRKPTLVVVKSSPALALVYAQNEGALRALQLMCSRSASLFASRRALMNIAASCHLPGVCDHYYTNVILGVSGNFTHQQLMTVQLCLGSSLQYIESDQDVYTTEGPQPRTHSEDMPTRARAPKSVVKAATTLSGERRRGSTPDPRVQKADGNTLVPEPRVIAPVAGDPVPGVPDVLPLTVNALMPPGTVDLAPLSAALPGELMAPMGAKIESLVAAQWGLDRLDQGTLPLDRKFRFGLANLMGTGKGVIVYSLDSGIRLTHEEFQGWSGAGLRASYGTNIIDGTTTAPDCNGHGTHTAGIAVGRNVGVAKEANVVAVRVLDCSGGGVVSDVISGLDWVAAHAVRPAVVTLSLGVPAGAYSQGMEDAVRNLVLNHSITVVVASGNSKADACTVSPSNVKEAIVVSATDLAGKFSNVQASDSMYDWSNTGPCVDIFAPGVQIYSACGAAGRCATLNDSSYTWASGTSMAAPFVTGAAAVFLGDNPLASPAEVRAALIGSSTTGMLDPALIKPGTPNRMLCTSNLEPLVEAAQGPASESVSPNHGIYPAAEPPAAPATQGAATSPPPTAPAQSAQHSQIAAPAQEQASPQPVGHAVQQSSPN